MTAARAKLLGDMAKTAVGAYSMGAGGGIENMGQTAGTTDFGSASFAQNVGRKPVFTGA
jgi:hypothetical protein